MARLEWVEGATPELALSDCEADSAHAFTWSLDNEPSSSQRVDVYVSEASTCTYDTRLADVEVYDPAQATATTTVRASQVVPGCDAVDATRYVCLRLSGGMVEVTASLEVVVDTVRPSAPQVDRIEAGDSLVRVEWSYPGEAPADLFGHRIRYRIAGSMDEPSEGPTLTPASLRSGTLTGLENGVTYEVWVVAVDDVGNVSSDPASGVLATPAPTRDFWEYYKSKGGQATGCQSGGGDAGWLALFGALALLLPAARRRRLRRWPRWPLLLLPGLLLAPVPARAQATASSERGVVLRGGPRALPSRGGQ